MQELLITILLTSQLITIFLLLKKKEKLSIQVDTQPFINQLNSNSEVLKTSLGKLPEFILNTLTGSANTHKGKLGELIGFLSIKAQYDRIIPLGNITDFIGIKLPTATNTGIIEFIDIKTGNQARLNKEQRLFKQLIINKQIGFKTIRIEELEGISDDTTSSTGEIN